MYANACFYCYVHSSLHRHHGRRRLMKKVKRVLQKEMKNEEDTEVGFRPNDLCAGFVTQKARGW